MTAEYPAAVAIVTSQALVPSFFSFLFSGPPCYRAGWWGGGAGEFGKWERGGKGGGETQEG